MIYMEKHNKAFDKNIIKYSRKTGNNKKNRRYKQNKRKEPANGNRSIGKLNQISLYIYLFINFYITENMKRVKNPRKWLKGEESALNRYLISLSLSIYVYIYIYIYKNPYLFLVKHNPERG